jgi:4-amino-4-deoxy-L-arabinose transferase-like glycosyltransferase
LSRRIGIVLLLSGALKLLLAIAFADLPPRYDEVEFLEFGRRIADGAAPALWRAPGYQSFVAGGLVLGGGHVAGVRILQVLLSVATTFVLYRIARRVSSERVAFAAATFTAFYPSLVAFSHLLWAETLFTFLVLLAFDRLLRAADDGRGSDAIVAGVLLGAAALVRSAGVALLLATAGWALFVPGRRVRTVRVLLAALVVIAPWSIHASLGAGRFVLIDTNPGWNLWSGNNEYVANDLQGIWGTGLRLDNGLDEAWGPALAAKGMPPALAGARQDGEWRGDVSARLAADGITDRSSPEADAWYRARALAEMRRDPLGVLRRAPLKLAGLWSPDFFLPRHVLRDWYGRTPGPVAAAIVLLTWLAALVPLVAGPFGLAAARSSAWRTLTLSWLAVLLVVHGLLFGVSRMHQPLVPLLVLAAAAWFLGERGAADAGADAAGRRRGIAAAVVAVLLMALSLPAVAGVYLAPSPRHAGIARALGAVRYLPLPGARHAAYMLAEVEAANGHPARAMRVLADLPDDDAEAAVLRAMAAESPANTRMWTARAAELRPDSPIVRALAPRREAP